MSRDYNEAKEYIEDIRDICDDFEGLCQRNLAANTGSRKFWMAKYSTLGCGWICLLNFSQHSNILTRYAKLQWRNCPNNFSFFYNSSHEFIISSSSLI